MGRILSIDFGLKRTGIAVTDPLQIIASPHATVPSHQLEQWIKDYLVKEPVEVLIVGWPTNTDGSATDTTGHVRGLIKRLKNQHPTLKVLKWDERFTSVIAHQALRQTGANKKLKQDKGLVDQVSATIILQEYLGSKPRLEEV